MDIKTKGFEMPNGNTHIFIPPSPTETERGGIKAKPKTTETVEVVIGEDDKLYAPSEIYITDGIVTDYKNVLNAYKTGKTIILHTKSFNDNKKWIIPLTYATMDNPPVFVFTCFMDSNRYIECELKSDESSISYNYIKDERVDTLKTQVDELKKCSTFIAEYGTTTYEEILQAYNDGKQVICVNGWLVAKLDILAPDNYAQFSGLDDLGNPALIKVTKEDAWTRTNVTKATTEYVDDEIIKVQERVDTIGKYINSVDPMLAEFGKMSAVDILKSVYSFRGGFQDNAGTLHITDPGIYLILQGGKENKQIIINQNGTEVLNETWNGIIILAYDNGVITPIGIATSLTLSGTIKTPGTFQGWTEDGSYSTTINYPSMCVVAYLGNGNINYLE